MSDSTHDAAFSAELEARPQSPDPSAKPVDLDRFEALLSSVSHDLRSPLLTMSLSAELLQDGLAVDREGAVLDALREGVKDLERMLDAVSALSRAHKRDLESTSTLGDLLAPDGTGDGSDPNGLHHHTLAADGRLVREFLQAVESAALEVAMTGDGIELQAPLPPSVPELQGSPLAGLLDSLKSYAGTAIEGLATIDLQAQRQGGSLAVSERRARLRLPLVNGSGE